MPALVTTLGGISRRLRYAPAPFDLPARMSGRAVRMLSRRLTPRDLAYTDIDGYLRRADLHDHMELEGFLGLDRLDAHARNRIRQGDWVLDVGANVGLISAQLCRLVGPEGRVWAIEPIERNVRRLHELADLNRLGQLRIFEGAMSNQTGRSKIRVPSGEQSGWASFTKSWGFESTVDTPTWALDELVAGEPGRIAFIKLDVEGFEPQVLEGATATLRSMHPLVMCEFNDVLLRDAGSSGTRLLEDFGRLGYRPLPAFARLARRLDGLVVDLILEAA